MRVAYGVLSDIVRILTNIFLLQNYVVLGCTHKGSNIFGKRNVQPSLCPFTKLSNAEHNYMQISYTSTYLNWTMNVESTR